MLTLILKDICFFRWMWQPVIPLSVEEKNLGWCHSISVIYLKLADFHVLTISATFCLLSSSVMIGSQNTALLHYSFPLVCVPKWPKALVSQVAVISFCKPSMNDYGKSCLQRFLFPLAFFPPTCLCFFFLFFSFWFSIPYFTLYPTA